MLVRLGLILALGVPAPPPQTWQWPMEARPKVIRHFDPPDRPWLPGHRGVDLAAPIGAQVRAAGPGTIGFAGRIDGRGVVVIDHARGLRTTYLPARPSVRLRQPVRAGDVIGRLERWPGHCPESCLHWGLRRGAGYLDPLSLLGRGRVRLLPHWHTVPRSPAPARTTEVDMLPKPEAEREPEPDDDARTSLEYLPVSSTTAAGGGGLLLLTAFVATWLIRRRRRTAGTHQPL